MDLFSIIISFPCSLLSFNFSFLYHSLSLFFLKSFPFMYSYLSHFCAILFPSSFFLFPILVSFSFSLLSFSFPFYYHSISPISPPLSHSSIIIFPPSIFLFPLFPSYLNCINSLSVFFLDTTEEQLCCATYNSIVQNVPYLHKKVSF